MNEYEKIYRTRIDNKSEKRANKVNFLIFVLSMLLTGRARIRQYDLSDFGFEYYFEGGKLIIRAYIIDNKFNSKKTVTATERGVAFYKDMNDVLFKSLNDNGILFEFKKMKK